MTRPREVEEGRQYQGVDEELAYTIETTKWGKGATPTSISAKVFDYTEATQAYADVTSTVMPTGSPSAAGTVITLPVLKLLTLDHLYRVEVKFTCNSNVFECYIWVYAER